MFNVGTGELAVILLLALIVLGPDKLPEAARTAGKYLAEFRRITGGFEREFRDAMDSAMASAPDRPDGDESGTGAFSLPVIDGREAEVPPLPAEGPAKPVNGADAPASANGSGGERQIDDAPPANGAAAAVEGNGSKHEGSRPGPPPGPRVMVDGPSSSFR